MFWHRRLGLMVFLVLVLGADVGAQEREPERLLGDIKAADQALSEGLTLEVTIEGPDELLRASRGSVVRRGTITVGEGTMGMTTRATYAEPIRYRRLGDGTEAFDYDEEGRLIVWRYVAEEFLVTPERARRSYEAQLYLVSEQGRVEAAEGTHTGIDHFRPGDNDATWDYDLAILALGRGYSRYLERVDRTAPLRSGRIEVHGEGSLVGALRLDIDSSAGDLVREATLTPPGRSEPSLAVEVTGAVDAATGLAMAGTIRIHIGGEMMELLSVRVTKAERRTDRRLLGDIARRLEGAIGGGATQRRVPGDEVGFIDPVDPPAPSSPCCICEERDPVIYEYFHWGTAPPGAPCSSLSCLMTLVDSAECKEINNGFAQDCNTARNWFPLIRQFSRYPTQPVLPPQTVAWTTHTYGTSCHQCRIDSTDYYRTACEVGASDCIGPILGRTGTHGLARNCPGGT